MYIFHLVVYLDKKRIYTFHSSKSVELFGVAIFLHNCSSTNMHFVYIYIYIVHIFVLMNLKNKYLGGYVLQFVYICQNFCFPLNFFALSTAGQYRSFNVPSFLPS